MPEITGEVQSSQHLSERVLLLCIEQSKAMMERRLSDASKLGDEMVEVLRQGIFGEIEGLNE